MTGPGWVERMLWRRPALVLAVVAALALFALQRLIDLPRLTPRFEVDPSMAALLPRAGPVLDTYRLVQRYFNDDDLLLVAWIGDELFTPARLAAWKQLTRTIEQLPGVTAVDSLASAYDVQAGVDETTIDPFLRTVPVDAAAAAAVRARALANPLFRGQLVAADGRGLLLAVHFTPGLATADLLQRLAQIRVAAQVDAGATEQIVSGPLLIRLEISRILNRDLYRVTPLAALATLLVAALALRSVHGIVLPLLANGAAVVMTLALFVASGHALNFVTVILPPVVYVVGFAYSIHVVSDFDRLFVPGITRAEAARLALHETFVPVTLTAVTTAIGFVALASTTVESIAAFGLFAALGTVLAWATALTVVPAGLALLPGQPQAPREQRAIAHWAARLTRFNYRHRRAVLGATIALTVAAALAATRIEVDTQVLHNFAAELPIEREFQRIGAVFAGPVPIQILVTGDAVDTFKQPAALRELVQLSAWLRTQPDIGGVYTLADYIAMLYRALAPDAAAGDPVPATARLVSHLLLGGAGNIGMYVEPTFQSTLVQVRANSLSTAAVNALAARIDVRLAQLPRGLHGRVTGTSYLIAHTVDDITFGQLSSLGTAIASTFVLLALLFGSVRAGVLAMIPNVVPIVLFFGLLGCIPIRYDLSTSLVADSVFGIAIDDTVVFMACFALAARRHGRGDAGIEATLNTILRPATFTMLSLCVGFLALMAGELRSQVEFGALAAATLFFAWLLDITLTPVLCRGQPIEPMWERWFAR